MNLLLSKEQKDVLNKLLDLYERSVTYRGENTRNQSFSIKPEKVFKDYNGDYTDQDDVDQFNRDMQSLADANLITIALVKGTKEIKKITLNVELLPDVYDVLARKDITQIRTNQIEMYEKYMGTHEIMDSFCKEQITRLNHYQDAGYPVDVALHVLELLKKVIGNTKDMMERELSVEVLGDTKLFEKSYRSRICGIIEKYGGSGFDFSMLDRREKERAILEEYRVFTNPSYVFFKGRVEIFYANGSVIKVTPDNPVAISSEVIDQINMLKIYSRQVVTVENLTSYNRIHDSGSTFIYLSGYHNTAKQRFLKKIAEYNQTVSWYHFGDIDPDGYYILQNLINKTGISFKPLYMGVDYLKKYCQYCKPLVKNDMIKAESLANSYFYSEVMDYMLVNNCKLEQEIVSWKNERVWCSYP